MSPDYLPTTDQDLDAWAINFADLITASPGTYALEAADATALNPIVDAFTAALAIATNPATRTTPTIAAKDAAKATMKTQLRSLANRVQAADSVSNEDKAALGLTIRDTSPAPVPVPTTFPLLQLIKATTLNHELRYADSDTPDSLRKPSGAAGMELRVQVSTVVITDPATITYRGFETRNPVQVGFDGADIGKQAYYSARWLTARGEPGPWSAIQSLTVAA